jgi:hypothetical protein
MDEMVPAWTLTILDAWDPFMRGEAVIVTFDNYILSGQRAALASQ